MEWPTETRKKVKKEESEQRVAVGARQMKRQDIEWD
jgi:hypothetical protein